MVNAIYRAKDTPGRPRGHDRGGRVRTYSTFDRDNLMIIEGPLALDWGRRKLGILPRLETGTLDESNPATPRRLELWIEQGIGVVGRPEWVFVKVHTHGCLPGNRRVVLGEPMRSVHEYLANRYNDGRAWRLHYVTAREMYNIVRAAEDGEGDDPGLYRDYEVKPPPMRGTREKVGQGARVGPEFASHRGRDRIGWRCAGRSVRLERAVVVGGEGVGHFSAKYPAWPARRRRSRGCRIPEVWRHPLGLAGIADEAVISPP